MKRINPLTILILWVVGCLVFALIVMIILAETRPGGEQAPLTFLSKFIYVIIYRLLILSILTIFLFGRLRCDAFAGQFSLLDNRTVFL
jgi:hypothetical protein